MAKLSKLNLARLAFLNDTVKFYGDDTSRRAAAPASRSGVRRCFYRTTGKDCRKCAIGRHIADEDYNIGLEGQTVNAIMGHLPEAVRALGSYFLYQIQALHDGYQYWSKTGITEAGKVYVTALTKQVKTGEYDN